MNDTIYRLQRISSEPLRSTAQELRESFGDGLEEPVLYDVRTMGEAEVALLIFEKYYFRSGSYASLTIEITSYDSVQKAVVVGSGGGEGFLNLTMGVNSSFAAKACKKLKELGFEEK